MTIFSPSITASYHVLSSEILEKKAVFTAQREECFYSPPGVSSGSAISSLCKRLGNGENWHNTREAHGLQGHWAFVSRADKSTVSKVTFPAWNLSTRLTEYTF
jgi:hypothetical protein